MTSCKKLSPAAQRIPANVLTTKQTRTHILSLSTQNTVTFGWVALLALLLGREHRVGSSPLPAWSRALSTVSGGCGNRTGRAAVAPRARAGGGQAGMQAE